MRSRIAWTDLVLAVVPIVTALMRFNLTAKEEPGSLETRVANLAKRFVIGRARGCERYDDAWETI